MSPVDPLRRLAEVAADIAPALVPAGVVEALRATAEAVRATFDAAAASVALLDEAAGELHYLAAAGAGAGEIEGLRLALGRGVAGYVAATGQSLVVDQLQADPRFAADVAERTGYVPSTILAVAVTGPDGGVVGVLSILDRDHDSGDLALAGAFADAVAAILPLAIATRDLGATLLRAVADAVAEGDKDLAGALRRRAARTPVADRELVRIAALFADLRRMGDREHEAALHMVEEFVVYARAGRRR